MKRLAAVATVLFTSLAAGCATEATDDGPDETDTEAAPRVVATLVTEDGATVTFIDEASAGEDPSIDVEILSPPATPIVDGLLAQQPSALELYNALGKGKAAPAALVREHELLAEIDPTYSAVPRTLTVIASVETENYDCDNFNAWSDAFSDWSPSLANGFIHANDGGNILLTIGYVPRLYFDVCRNDNDPVGQAILTLVERTTSASHPTWSQANTTTALGDDQRWRFYRNSPSCSSWQYRLRTNSAPTNGTYHRATAYANPWSCSIILPG